MAALQLDVGGSSTSPVSVGVGGNAGIQFAPKGANYQMLIILGAILAVVFLMQKGKF